MAENIKELQARLRFVAEQGDLQKVKQATDQVEAGMKKIGGATDDANKRLMKMRENAEKLQQLGTTMGIAGAAILAPFLLAARTYTQQVGKSEETSRRWISANEKLNEAQIRIGRETAKILVPLLEKGADLADKFATFIEKNPRVLDAILAVGGGLAAGATVITLIAQAQRLIFLVSTLSGAGTVAGGAGTAGILAGLTPLLPAIIAAVAAYYALNAIKIPGQQESAWASGTRAGGEMLAGAAGGFGTLFGGKQLGNEWFLATAKALGVLSDSAQDAAKSSKQAAGGIDDFTNAQLKAYLAYVKADQEAEQTYKQKRSDLISNARQAELEAERSYQKQRTDLISNASQVNLEAEKAYQKERSDLISNASQAAQRESEDFNRKRSQTLRDFYQSEQQSEADYYANRMKITRDASLEAARAEEDHQRELRNLQADHADRMNDLAASRDALGMVREMRAAEKARRASEETYQVEVRRKNQDLANTLGDNEAQFATQREQRFAQFQQQLADEDEQRKVDAQRRKEDFDQQLLELDNQYKIEAQKRNDDFDQQLLELDNQHKIEAQKRSDDLNKQLRDLADQFNQDRNQRRQACQLQLQDTADALSQERTLKAQYNAAMLADLRNIYNQALADTGGSSLPSRDIGGYTSNGVYRMHNHEFVMTDKTTSVVEALAGGALDQDKLLSLLAGGTGGRGQLQYNDNRRIDSRLSSEDRRLINQDTLQILGDLVHGII
jgi:hypothetical protein